MTGVGARVRLTGEDMNFKNNNTHCILYCLAIARQLEILLTLQTAIPGKFHLDITAEIFDHVSRNLQQPYQFQGRVLTTS